jgi:hypothetical protein
MIIAAITKTIVIIISDFFNVLLCFFLQPGQFIVGAFVLKVTPCFMCSVHSSFPHLLHEAIAGFPQYAHSAIFNPLKSDRILN